MTSVQRADDLAVGGVQRGEQAARPVTLVVVGGASRGAGHHRQVGCGAIERLDLALLVHAQHQRPLRRVHVEPDDVLDLLDEQRVLGELPVLHAVRLQPERSPDPRDRRLIESPVVAAIWRVDQCVPPSGGAVSNVLTITSSTRSSPTVLGRPDRGSSTSPSSLSATNRRRHLPTVAALTESRAATSLFECPCSHSNTICERNANPCAVRRLPAHPCNCARSPSVSSKTALGRPRVVAIPA